MSFSIEEKKIEIDDITMSPPSGGKKYAYNLYSFLHKADGYINDVLKETYGDYTHHMAFSFYAGSDDVTVYYKIVKTDGPVIGFLGYYIDLSSGYVLLDTEKSHEYIPLVNFYSWLEQEKNIRVNPELMMSLMERYKIGDITNEDFSKEMAKAVKGNSNSSIISKLINQETEDIKDSKDGKPLFKVFSDFFYDTVHVLDNMGKEFDLNAKRDDDRLSQYAYLETKGPGITRFIRSLQLSIQMSGDLKAPLAQVRANYDNIEDSRMRALSTMVNTGDLYDRRFFNASTYRDMTNTDSLILNLRDIVEEREDDAIVDFDDLALRSSKPSKEEIYEVIEKIGVDEYMSGRELGNVTRGLGSRPEVGDLINKATAAIRMDDASIPDKLNIKISNITSSFRKMVRFYKGSLEIIDTITR